MSELVGRVGGTVKGYEIQATWDGQKLFGRVGGRLQGKNLQLILTGLNVHGVLGDDSVTGTIEDNKIEVLLNSTLFKHQLKLIFENSKLIGRFSGGVDGKDIDCLITEQELRGRIGGKVSGKDVSCQFSEDIPSSLVALAIVCTYKALEDANRTRIV